MTNRWRDHVGPGEDRHIKFRSDKELDDAIANDDLKSLESLINKEDVLTIQKNINRQINDAIKYSEDSSFPETKEITDNVYG
jgi:TPP-dependent pyruvate/acetoin dehydrogenase alpha subunit